MEAVAFTVVAALQDPEVQAVEVQERLQAVALVALLEQPILAVEEVAMEILTPVLVLGLLEGQVW